MRSLETFASIYICPHPLDMRLSFQGLSQAVGLVLKKDITADSLFVFYNKRRSLIKILYWDRTGFALWIKKLDKERFHIRESMFVDGVCLMTSEELRWLLSGVDLRKIKPHKNVNFSHVF